MARKYTQTSVISVYFVYLAQKRNEKMIRLVSRSRYVYRKRDVMNDVYLLAANTHQMTSYSYCGPHVTCCKLRPTLLAPTDNTFHFKYGFFLVQLLFQMSFDFPKNLYRDFGKVYNFKNSTAL
jgi:hypothetical protein